MDLLIWSKWGGAKQSSGKTVNDYSEKITYILRNGEKESHYNVILYAQNGIPRVDVITEGFEPIVTKKNYVHGTISISNNPEYGLFETNCEIRLRGNATSRFPKKPYKIKLSQKTSLFGMPSDKHWLLLAEFSDKSLLRTAFQCKLSELLCFDYTIKYTFVDLYLNNDYQGVYYFAEQVRVGNHRVNVEKDGYLFEKDYYYKEEPLYFTTDTLGYHYTFKYPDADKSEIVYGDANYEFILDYMNKFERSLIKIEGGSNEYLHYINETSFAKWFIGQELLGNYDPNRFFVLKSKKDKLKMEPMWDAEWSMGLATLDNGWKQPPYQPNAESEIWKKKEYFKYLLKDSYFRDVVKREWYNIRNEVYKIKDNIVRDSKRIEYAQKQNFKKWPILDEYISVGLIALGAWENEVSYLMSFFDQRVTWFDKYVNNDFNYE